MIYELTDDVLRQFVQFDSVAEMNEVVAIHRRQLSKGERQVLDAIARFACKYVGVSFVSKAKLAVLSGYASRRSVIRVCQRLESYGIIKQYETRRAKGDRGQTVNIIVIQPANLSQADDTGNGHRLETPKETTYTIQMDTEDTTDVIKRGLKSAMPAPIYAALSPFFNGEDLYETYGILLRAKASGEGDDFVSLEDYADQYMDVFYSAIRQVKLGKVDYLQGYLYASWRNLTKEIVRREVYPNWLQAGHDIIYEYQG